MYVNKYLLLVLISIIILAISMIFQSYIASMISGICLGIWYFSKEDIEVTEEIED